MSSSSRAMPTLMAASATLKIHGNHGRQDVGENPKLGHSLHAATFPSVASQISTASSQRRQSIFGGVTSGKTRQQRRHLQPSARVGSTATLATSDRRKASAGPSPAM